LDTVWTPFHTLVMKDVGLATLVWLTTMDTGSEGNGVSDGWRGIHLLERTSASIGPEGNATSPSALSNSPPVLAHSPCQEARLIDAAIRLIATEIAPKADVHVFLAWQIRRYVP